MDKTTALDSFPEALRACVFGATGGIGRAFADALVDHPRVGRVYVGARSAVEPRSDKMVPFTFDLDDEATIGAACAAMAGDGKLHLVIVATGILHREPDVRPEKTWRSLTREGMAEAFAINTIGPALIAKHVLDGLAAGEKSVFAALSARVGSISDNALGGWHSYRSSKAALNMLIRNVSIELRSRNGSAIAVALHPGTVDTSLSAPFRSNVRPGQLVSPAESAAHLLDVIDRLTPSDSGQLFAWDGSEIPF